MISVILYCMILMTFTYCKTTTQHMTIAYCLQNSSNVPTVMPTKMIKRVEAYVVSIKLTKEK